MRSLQSINGRGRGRVGGGILYRIKYTILSASRINHDVIFLFANKILPTHILIYVLFI